jgi:hypothetical protein
VPLFSSFEAVFNPRISIPANARETSFPGPRNRWILAELPLAIHLTERIGDRSRPETTGSNELGNIACPETRLLKPRAFWGPQCVTRPVVNCYIRRCVSAQSELMRKNHRYELAPFEPDLRREEIRRRRIPLKVQG